MRTNIHLQERHLSECVKRKIITSEELESVLAVARGMAPTEGELAPDFRWVSLVHALVAAAVVGAPLGFLFTNLERFTPLTVGIVCGLTGLAAVGMAALLRRSVSFRAPAAILTAGAVLC